MFFKGILLKFIGKEGKQTVSINSSKLHNLEKTVLSLQS